jgi:hypothetical protein
LNPETTEAAPLVCAGAKAVRSVVANKIAPTLLCLELCVPEQAVPGFTGCLIAKWSVLCRQLRESYSAGMEIQISYANICTDIQLRSHFPVE